MREIKTFYYGGFFYFIKGERRASAAMRWFTGVTFSHPFPKKEKNFVKSFGVEIPTELMIW